MAIPLIYFAVTGTLALMGGAIYTVQNMDRNGQPVLGDPIRRKAASSFDEFEGALDDSDTVDPLANRLDETGQGKIPMNQDLKNALTAAQTQTCTDCPSCGFLRDGKLTTASFPFLPAMDYQNRVVRLVGMGMPPFAVDFVTKRIDEWQMPGDSGHRKFDGLATLPCALIEAKLGYSKYLLDNWNVGRDSSLPVDILATIPEVDTSVENAEKRMGGILKQMQSHDMLAKSYPPRGGFIWHHVIWGCSNTLLTLFCGGTAALNGLSRIRVFHIPVGMLPPSQWTRS